jgi:PadR family transcriptional regulator PadR
MDDLRITLAVAQLLRAFLDSPAEPRYGYELMRLTGFPSGKLYPMLAKLEHAGWLIRERENIDPVAAGRPARRLYRLSPHAAEAARRELAALSQQVAPPEAIVGVLRPEGGMA